MSPITPEAERRRRLITRALPMALIALASFVAGVVIGSESPEQATANRFASAWEQQDFPAMHAELTAEAQGRFPVDRFTQLYADAARTATLSGIDVEGASDASGGVVRVPVSAHTNAFGNVERDLELPVTDERVAWEPHLVFAGLARGEALDRRVRAPKRAPILAMGDVPLAEGEAGSRSSPLGGAATNVAGETGAAEGAQAAEVERLGFEPDSPTGVSGLEKAFNARLAGKPGGELLAVRAGSASDREGSATGGSDGRVLASSEPVKGEPVKTTISPDLQEAAVTALGSRFGGVAVLDAKDGSVRALAGIAYSSPQPPGSIFKIVTTVAALEGKDVKLDDQFPVETAAAVEGREIPNAGDEACGGSFETSFAKSCNSVFAPLGAKVGEERLVETSEKFGFNSPPSLFDAEARAAVEAPEPTIPEDIGTDLDVAVSAIGQGQVLATPLIMASVSQTIANGGVRRPTPLVTEPALKADAEPVRVTSETIANTVRELMVGVISGGTGTAAALPDVQVAGKTGTAELGAPEGAPEGQEQDVDAWFTAFAPAKSPKLAVAVMVVNADGSGGEVAAPIAREVLSKGVG